MRRKRAREARQRDARERLSTEPSGFTVVRTADALSGCCCRRCAGGRGRRLDVPFSKLIAFFVKRWFAAIPALIILTALLWIRAVGLQVLFPDS